MKRSTYSCRFNRQVPWLRGSLPPRWWIIAHATSDASANVEPSAATMRLHTCSRSPSRFARCGTCCIRSLMIGISSEGFTCARASDKVDLQIRSVLRCFAAQGICDNCSINRSDWACGLKNATSVTTTASASFNCELPYALWLGPSARQKGVTSRASFKHSRSDSFRGSFALAAIGGEYGKANTGAQCRILLNPARSNRRTVLAGGPCLRRFHWQITG